MIKEYWTLGCIKQRQFRVKMMEGQEDSIVKSEMANCDFLEDERPVCAEDDLGWAQA